MRLFPLLLLLAATTLPSTYAIQCAVGTLIPNAAGQVDVTNNNGANIVMSYTCPTESTGCVTAFMRQGFNTETSRLVIVSCQSGSCTSESEVVAPDHWYDIRCCTSNNCNREGLNNIDWNDRTPTNNQGGIPTFPSFPTFSVPTNQPDEPTDIPSDTPTDDPFTPTSAAGTQSPVTILRCRQGTINPSSNGEIGPDTDSWKSDTCQSGQTYCVTFFERTDERKFIMANCAETCTPSVLVTSPTSWMETTCCTGDNCNNDINKLSAHDWGERSMNDTVATMPPNTQPPTGSSPTTQVPTTSPTASPITGSTGPTTRPTNTPGASSTGINNVAFTTAIFSPLVIFTLAITSLVMSF